MNSCREFRNEKNWKTYCGNICENFSITKFKKYYVGDYKYFFSFVDYVKLKQKEMVDSAKKETSINPDEIANDPMSMARILSESDHVKKFEKFLKSPFLVHSGDIDLAVYKASFESDGFDPIKSSYGASINENSY